MPKKTKFIDKTNSTHYHLLHRSQTDGAYAEDGVPSEFVLVAANEMGNLSSDRATAVPSLNEKLRSRKDHINELGFKNDGYDYSKHMKEMGEGRFIGRDGQQGRAPLFKEAVLPTDALPSGIEMARDLEAITIDHDLMDPDLHAALFEDADEDGEFEELDDDFCNQVMKEDNSGDFDFDAHIAALIAKSEQATRGAVHVAGRAFNPNDGEKKKTAKNKVRIEGLSDEEDEEFEEFSDYEEDDDFDGKAVPQMSSQAMAQLDEQFENALSLYDDDELGYLEYADDDELVGADALEDDNELLDKVMDEFLQEKKDAVYADGTEIVKKGNRRMLLPQRAPTTGGSWLPEGEEVDGANDEAPVDTAKEKEKQLRAQAEAEAEVQELLRNTSSGKTNPNKGIETCQQYLAEEREENEWDCESILSTYSTLDNHPKLIKSANSKYQPYKSRHVKRQEKEEAAVSAVTAILKSNGSAAASTLSTPVAAAFTPSSSSSAPPPSVISAQPSKVKKGPVQIVLGGKMGLPEEYSRKDNKDDSVASAFNTKPKKTSSVLLEPRSRHRPILAKVREENIDDNEKDVDDIEEEEEDEDGNSDSESDGEIGKNHRGKVAKVGRKKESAEEKKQRKQLVKQQRKDKRVQKKGIKEAFRSEGSRLARTSANEQSIDHVSVYHYGNK